MYNVLEDISLIYLPASKRGSIYIYGETLFQLVFTFSSIHTMDSIGSLRGSVKSWTFLHI